MNLSEFARLLQHSPSLLQRLLQRQGCDDTTEVSTKVLSFYSHLTTADILLYQDHKSLPLKRINRLANLAGLDPSIALISLRIFENYVENKQLTDKSHANYTEEEVRFWLTAGSIPIECCFLIERNIYIWDRERKDFFRLFVVDGDSLLHQASADYLSSIGSAFSSIDEARSDIIRRNLDNEEA